LIEIPTGMGKTDAIILGWLWRRRFDPRAEIRSSTPRRLIYCLPMRVLVEQTQKKAKEWLGKLGILADSPGDDAPPAGLAADYDGETKRIAVTVLMGGEQRDNWDSYPERDAIIIGTQDMLLSRALNRGYGMSRYRWPVHFGLLNNDCLWVMDEVQLMGAGVETSAQLHGFYNHFGTFQRAKHVWMSATLDAVRLDTVDHPRPEAGRTSLALSEDDKALSQVVEKFEAKKALKRAPLRLEKGNERSYPEAMADLIVESHKKDTLTLAVVNRVDRAQRIYEALLKRGRSPVDTAVLHSRFREGDRKKGMGLLEAKEGGIKDRIIVSTQVVEAGVDVSAHTMISELAPWSSLVQRFGRCNRRGRQEGALVVWVDIDFSDEGIALPYDPTSLEEARDLIEGLDDAGPKTLSSINYEEPFKIRPVVRRKDLLDLFDTTPDLTGNDLDVSRYIREDEDRDVQVYWREVEDRPSGKLRAPERAELCSVSLSQISQYLKKSPGWVWDPLESDWINANGGRLKSGMLILLDPKNGGYRSDIGWVGTEGKDLVEVITPELENTPDPSMDEDSKIRASRWVGLAEHTNDVSLELTSILKRFDLPEEIVKSLEEAARWHDAGKLHLAFQNMLLSGRENEASLRARGPWAKSKVKSNSDDKSRRPVYWVEVDGVKVLRPYFRHELASALAWLQTDGQSHGDVDLVAYLIAAHHGKVRVSIRSLVQERTPEDDRLFARGVWDGDVLPAHPGLLKEDVKLDLSLMQMGGGSWLERTLRLRDDPGMGPFRLAYLESILRVADWRASRKEGWDEGSL
jgi:CRISPR-associated endonuclease/helicase Cas3